jgi:hypothetical protein
MPAVADLRQGQLWQLGRDTLLQVSTPSPDSPNPGSTMTVLLDRGQAPGRTTVRYHDALDIRTMTEPSDRLLSRFRAAWGLPDLTHRE